MGTVYLVGAGPGDPGLLTLRGAQLIRRADVLVYDARINERLLELARPDAERICVGAARGEQTAGAREVQAGPAGFDDPPAPNRRCASQEEVNRALVEAAADAEVVVRLKEGDPFIFGRGGEEALAVREAGVACEIVPGVTAGLACAEYAGIPITHAALAGEVTLLNGREDAQRGATVVAYMADGRLAELAGRLIAEGRARGDTPAAAIAWGSWPRQSTVVAPLADLAERAAEAGVAKPCIAIIGDVVGLREKLAWFERRPLFGRRVLVTRARAQAADLTDMLEALGAESVQFPTIRLAPPRDPEPLRAAAQDVAFYDWIIFTSVNGVDQFWRALEDAGHDARALGGVQVACIGPATAAALDLRGVRADLVPATYVAEAVVEILDQAADLAGSRILLPRAYGARDVLPAELRGRGAHLDEVEAYRMVPDTEGADELRRRLQAGELDAVTFTSSSTVRNFADAVGTELGSAVVAVIGPITAETAVQYGLRVDVEAREHTVPGLVRALATYFQETAARRG